MKRFGGMTVLAGLAGTTLFAGHASATIEAPAPMATANDSMALLIAAGVVALASFALVAWNGLSARKSEVRVRSRRDRIR